MILLLFIKKQIMDTLGNYLSKLSKNTKYLKYVSIGILAYSAYHFLRMRNNKQKKNNKKEINNKNEVSIPEHTKYDNGWYAELDEVIQKNLTMPAAAAEPTLSEPPPTIQEVTPRGEILMYYDVKNKAFEYYSNNKNLPYKTLDAVARKYVCIHNVPSIYVDIREEVKKGLDKYNNQTNNNSNVLDKKTSPSSSVFAVYKNYKSGIKIPSNNGNIRNNSDSKTDSKKIILKDNVNKFIFKGWINDYALDVKAREKKEKSSTKINKHKSEDHHNDHNDHNDQDNHNDQNDQDDQDDHNDHHHHVQQEKEEINISYAEFKKRMS